MSDQTQPDAGRSGVEAAWDGYWESGTDDDPADYVDIVPMVKDAFMAGYQAALVAAPAPEPDDARIGGVLRDAPAPERKRPGLVTRSAAAAPEPRGERDADLQRVIDDIALTWIQKAYVLRGVAVVARDERDTLRAEAAALHAALVELVNALRQSRAIAAHVWTPRTIAVHIQSDHDYTRHVAVCGVCLDAAQEYLAEHSECHVDDAIADALAAAERLARREE